MTEEARRPETAELPVAARAPYNFVPISEDILFRYAAPEEVPAACGLDPMLKSGEISFTLTADSEVFFGGRVENGQKTIPFYQTEGHYAVPASTIRGALRGNMKILTCGKIGVGEEYSAERLLYRQPHVPKEGKVRRPMAEAYVKALGMDPPRIGPDGKERRSTPKNVSAGYLHCRGRSYFIRLTEREPFWMKPTDPVMQDFLSRGTEPLRKTVVPVWYRTKCRPDGTEMLAEIFWEPGEDRKEGTLLFKGKAGRKNSYLFPRELPDREIPLSREDVETCEQSPRAWILPRDGKRTPVFFVRHQTDGGEGIYFALSWFPHIAFRHSMKHGLPPVHWENLDAADYASAIFGKKGQRARVFFSDCKAEEIPGGQLPKVWRRSFQPQPVYFPNYVLDGKHYDEPGFRVRGHKEYWLKNPDWQALMARPEGDLPKTTKGDELKDFAPLPAGSRFRGIIRFRNLHADELGALLWALKLEDGCFHSMGRGRAEGFGRMKAEIHRLVCYDVDTMYQSLSPAHVDETEKMVDYIRCYQSYAAERLSDGIKPENRPEIRDFFYIRKTICSGPQVQFMRKEEHKDVRIPLPTIREIREGKVEFC